MTKQTVSASGKVWEAIENERRRDRLIRRVSISAWSITFFFVAILAVLVCMQVVQLAKGAAAGCSARRCRWSSCLDYSACLLRR